MRGKKQGLGGMFSICRVSYLLSLKYSFCVLCAHAAVCNMKHLYPSTLELRSFSRSCKGNGAPPVVSLSPNTRQTARSTTGNSENSHDWSLSGGLFKMKNEGKPVILHPESIACLLVAVSEAMVLAPTVLAFVCGVCIASSLFLSLNHLSGLG